MKEIIGFTPEQWEYGTPEVEMDQFVRVKGQPDKIIAEVRGWGWLSKKGNEAAAKEQDANGHLLAAAPELYAECKSLLRQRDALKTLSDLQEKLLACYRTGKNPGSIIDKLREAKAVLAAIEAPEKEKKT